MELRRTFDARSRRVVLEEERWDHIRQEHPDIDLDDVMDAISEATQYMPGNYPGSEVLVATGPGPAKHLLVVVETVADGARVITARAQTREDSRWKDLP